MNYEQARAHAVNVSRSGSILGLDSIENLMHELGDIQEQLKIIHIAGTNGKGSTGAYLERVLIEAGYRVGRYSSPTVFDPMEVWRINLQSMSHEEYADIMEQVKCACDRMVEKGMEHPTIFEVETAMAFLYFYQKKCDYVLLEVGMGGRTDATNLIRKPVCSVITSVSMDHMQFLGNTLTEIAQAKAGIIKKDCPIVTIMQKAEAMEAIKAEAEKQHARLSVADVSKVSVENDTLSEIKFDYPGLGTVTTRLTGTYQVENCCLAVTVLKDVLGIADQTILDGIQNTVWPGRFEVIGEQPLFIIDGAHNEDAALQLSASVEKYFTNIPITYIIGVLADKEHKKVLEAMLPYAGAAFTVTPDNPRAMKAEELASEAEAIVARLWKERAGKPEKAQGAGNSPQGAENSPQGAGVMESLPKVRACSSMKEAVQLALEHTKKDGVILAFGSLSYLKEMRRIMQSD